jgi:hypothetical protein
MSRGSARSRRAAPSLFAVPLVGLLGCAELAGLSQYGSSATDDPVASDDAGHLSSAEVGDPDVSAGGDSSTPTNDDASSPDEMSVGEDRASEATVGDEVADAATPDGSDGADSGPSDAAGIPDNFACGPSTCNGCCNSSGNCVGGQSVDTCGSGGHACNDCASAGACHNGACTSPAPDTGAPPMCTTSQCSSCAVGQTGCCKSDQTCGCRWSAFTPCE